AIGNHERRRLEERYGPPRLDAQPGAVCRSAIVGLGKLGGREPNYHSDHHVLFLYEGEGTTSAAGGQQPTNNRRFFQQWAQAVLKRANRTGHFGRLYEVTPGFRTRPASSIVAMNVDELREAFAQGHFGALERQALCRARPLGSDHEFSRIVQQQLHELIRNHPWSLDDARQIMSKRAQLETTA